MAEHEHDITLTVNGRRASRPCRGPQDARRLPPRGLRAHRHAPRLRARRLRRVHGAARRRGGALVPAVRGAGRRRRGHDHRGLRRRRRHALDRAGGVPPGPRPAVRVLHARLRRLGARVPRGEPDARPTTRSARRSRATSAAAPATRGSSTRSAAPPRRSSDGAAVSGAPTAGRFVGQSVLRREDPRLLTGHGALRRRRRRARACSTRRSCAATSRAAASRGSTSRRPRALDGVHAVLTGADLDPGAGSLQPTMFQSAEAGPCAPLRLLADDDVRFVGDAVALVVAESRYLAEDALRARRGRLRAAARRSSTRRSRAADDEHLVHPELGSNVAMDVGTPDRPGARADLRVGGARRDRADRAAPAHDRADGDPRHHRRLRAGDR